MTAKILIELSKVFRESLLLFKVCLVISPENSRFSLNNWITLKAKMWCNGALPFKFSWSRKGAPQPFPPPPKLLPQGWYSIFVQEAVSAGVSIHIALVTVTSRDSSTRRETAAVKPACPVFWPKSWSTKDKWQTSNSACQRGWRLKWKQSILTRKVPLLPWRRNAFCLIDSLR